MRVICYEIKEGVCKVDVMDGYDRVEPSYWVDSRQAQGLCQDLTINLSKIYPMETVEFSGVIHTIRESERYH